MGMGGVDGTGIAAGVVGADLIDELFGPLSVQLVDLAEASRRRRQLVRVDANQELARVQCVKDPAIARRRCKGLQRFLAADVVVAAAVATAPLMLSLLLLLAAALLPSGFTQARTADSEVAVQVRAGCP